MTASAGAVSTEPRPDEPVACECGPVVDVSPIGECAACRRLVISTVTESRRRPLADLIAELRCRP